MTLSPTSSFGGGTAGAKLYDYTVAGAAKSSIDTSVDDGGNGAVALPTTYQVLEVFMRLRTDDVGVAGPVDIRVNNDSSALYDRVFATVLDTTLAGGNAISQTSWRATLAGAGMTSGVFGPLQLAIAGYADSVFKSCTVASGTLDTTAANARLAQQVYQYRSTTAISRLSVAAANGGQKLAIGSRLLIFAR